ncbi:transient receptor potential cation channel subfamily M member 5 [Cricetulus griseus]|nr:transient receptor potential cation channel subfamily M member 5 [Cricetulus griseus]
MAGASKAIMRIGKLEEANMQTAQSSCPGSPPDTGDGWEPVLCRGEVDFGGSGKKRGKFVKVPSSVTPSILFELLLTEWHLPAPNLVVSLVGEERPFAMKSWLRDILRKGLVKAAQSTGAWILTSALRVGLARHVGQAVRDHSLASTSTKVRVVAIGMASLDRILHCQLLDGVQLQNIAAHPHLLTVYDFEKEGSEDLDTVILKALVKDELKLAVAWDRVDIAKSEIFNGDVEWKSCDLEEVMTDALVSNKPDFVRLFVDSGADMAEFLTYGRLQQLYHSVSPKSLLFELLQRKHEEGRLTLAGLGAQQARELPIGLPAFSLHEVSRVLKDFLHDACRGFYQDGCRMEERGPPKRPTGQKWLPDLNRKSEDPWRDLFLWAVLQNRYEMATYFWAMGQEGVAAALAACKIIKEMSHLEKEAEVARTMRESKYEQLALECYSNSEDRAFALLVRRNHSWSRTTCLHLATEADAKAFFAHDGVQAFLTKIWWGDMATGTPILRLLGAFTCPALIYTNLIAFSEDVPQRMDLEDLQEPDSLDVEKSFLCSQGGQLEKLTEMPRAPGDSGPQAAFLLTRWRKFWGAPVTVFLGNVVMYFAFLFLFAYVLLVDFRPPPQGPSGSEVTLYFWVFTLVLEEIRQGFFTDEDTHLVKKFTLYVEDNWNKCDMVAIFLFIVGVTCRMLPSVFEAGRTILAIDFMVFTLRLIHIFAIHKQLGPKIIIVERMMKDVFFFLFFLSVWLVAYGVTTQALLHPHDGRLEWIFRRVLYRPYLQIFGQIPLDEIDEARVNCSLHPLLLENSASCPNLYANWVVILLLVTFLLVTNVLLMNLLIAMFSYTFQVVQGNADVFWKFQRYHLIVEYHGRPALAPPFILLSHLSLVLKRVFRKEVQHKRQHLGAHITLQGLLLSPTLLERDLPDPLDQKIITWEAVQKENFLSAMEKRRRDSEGEVLRKTAQRWGSPWDPRWRGI